MLLNDESSTPLFVRTVQRGVSLVLFIRSTWSSVLNKIKKNRAALNAGSIALALAVKEEPPRVHFRARNHGLIPVGVLI